MRRGAGGGRRGEARRLRRVAAAALLAAALALPGPAPLGAQPVGPALAPTAHPLSPLARADGTEATLVPEAAPAPRLTEATPDTPVDDSGSEATVLADLVTLTGDRRLEASGGVVVWYEGTRLTAPRVIYDGAADRLYIEGPIQLTRPGDRGTDREAVMVADAAELDGRLRAGLLRGARLVLARELQFAAAEIRVDDDGRTTVLDRVVASACRVCAGSPTPIWEIRARRITHDRETHRLTFERPQFRVFGLPLAAVPVRLVAPDPTVERMSGFLRPTLRNTSSLGFGIKLPYFRTLGDSADLTLTPYIASSRTLTLEARYRQAFRGGALEWRGAVSRDDIREGETRGYSLAAARFALPDGYRLGLQAQWASDRDYLDDYAISSADRLWSGATLDRVTPTTLTTLRAGAYRTLREDEDQDLLPTEVVDAAWSRRFETTPLGGIATLDWSFHAHRRPSDTDILGRDVARLSFGGEWQRQAILGAGVLADLTARLDADAWWVRQDSSLEDAATRAVPTLAAGLRWPLIRGGAGGTTDILEPVIRLAWSAEHDDDGIPAEDASFPELDEGSLYALDRIPGRDRAETGLRAALGLGWTRLMPNGDSFGLLAGRVVRAEDDPALEEAGLDTGLDGRRSDWLVAASFQQPEGLAAAGRALIDDDADLSRADLRLGLMRPGMQVAAGYAFVADPSEDESREQLVLDAGWQLAQGWWAEAGARYDLALDRPQRANLGLAWRNECITVEAALEREWDEPGGDPAETSFDLSVRLAGFGRVADAPGTVARRSCMR